MRTSVALLVSLVLALVPATLLSSAEAGGTYAVTLASSAPTAKPGQKVTFSGKVSPKASGKEVRLQYLSVYEGDRDWRTWRTTRVRSDGTYSVTFTPQVGHLRWRVLKPSDSVAAGAVSTVLMLKTYGWFGLAEGQEDEPAVRVAEGEQHLRPYGPVSVAGHTVSKYFSTTSTAAGTTRWYTDHSCIRIQVTVGLDDDSTDGTAGRFRVHGGSKQLAVKYLKNDTYETLDATFSESVPWIRFSGEALYDTATYVNGSNPRLLCAFVED